MKEVIFSIIFDNLKEVGMFSIPIDIEKVEANKG